MAEAVRETADKFGGIDVLINNASAIRTTGTLDTSVRRYDLMHGSMAAAPSSAPRGPVPETWTMLPTRTAREKPMMGSKGDDPEIF